MRMGVLLANFPFILDDMNERYYKIPFDFGALLDADHQSVALCGELESIDQRIELLLMTYPGEHYYDRGFGSGIWDMDFERIVSLNVWKTNFTEFLSDAISCYEKRISDCHFRLVVEDVLLESAVPDRVSVKKRVDVYIDARLCSTDERCGFCYTMYLGPLSKN